MNIALIGATGFVGTAFLTELLARDHRVTVLARDPAKLAARPGLKVVKADALDAQQVAAAVAGHDAVISAYNPGWSEVNLYEMALQGYDTIVAGVKQAGVKRFLQVGGAGTLLVAPGVQLVDTEGFPPEYLTAARAMREVSTRIGQEISLNWSLIIPPIALVPGERSGKYRLGKEDLLPGNGDAPASITVADLAVALVDELETARHKQQRFTVAN